MVITVLVDITKFAGKLLLDNFSPLDQSYYSSL
jgi:hypothetical protein